MNKSSERNFRLAEYFFVLIIVLTFFFLWETPFSYPFKIFVVFLHEATHALAIFLTGGIINETALGFDLGGRITANGGNEIIILSSGYLGSLLFGLIIFISAELQKIRSYIYFMIAFLLAFILILSTPTLEFVIIGITSVILLVIFGFFVKIRIVKILVKSFALLSAVYVFIDIKQDMLSKEFSSDAQLLANVIGVNQFLVSAGWLLISFILIALVLKFSFNQAKTVKEELPPPLPKQEEPIQQQKI